MECMKCGKKTIEEQLCPKCQKTYKIVQCGFCNKDIVRDKTMRKQRYMCQECRDNPNV